MTRRLAAAGLVIACAAATGLAARRFPKTYVEQTEAFRQKGPAGAPVTIVEFSDFECPACRVAEPVIAQILALYGARSRFLFKNFPLERVHPYARQAATDAECAGRQGKFWPYHDTLYAHQDDWTNDHADEKLHEYARQLGVDLKTFDACRADPTVQQAIDADIKEGDERWVGATPTFFINGTRFVGARQLSERGSRFIEKAVGQ